MGTDEIDDDRRQILRYWWMLELFSPQKVPKLTKPSTRPDDRQVIKWGLGEPLPWDVLRPPQSVGRTRRVWQHTLYLGVYDLEDTYQHLHRAFAEDRDAYDERPAGFSACAGLLLDEHGVLMAGSAVLSSALWAVARIGNRTRAHDAHWADGFPAAASAFTERVDAFDGLRREAADAQTAPAHDEASLQVLLRIAHEAAGIDGTAGLASERIVIASVAVAERRGEDSAASIDFLNSFFLEDLAAVQKHVQGGRCPTALSAYLTGDASIPVELRIDVMTDHAAVNAGAEIERLPKGRWPSEPAHGLALRQQFAVNQALHDFAGTRGLMGVNGPPGTGKTTMLRDVLAGNVVERARRLASLPRPEDAFTATTHQWTAIDGYPRKVRQLRDELTGFEMVVASANNAAVENVSTEIPAREAIADKWMDEADYFADIASATLESSGGVYSEDLVDLEDDADPGKAERRAWGLVAARLGNKSNRGAFRSAFWFDKTDPRTKQRVPGTGPRMQTRLAQWRDGTVPHKSWEDARADFRRAEGRVDEIVELRRRAQTRLERLPAALKEESGLATHAGRLGTDAAAAVDVSRAYSPVAERVETEHFRAIEARDRHIETRPRALETLFTLGRAARDWRTRLEPLEEGLRVAEQHRQQSRTQAQHLAQQAQELRAEANRTEASRAQAAREVAELRRRVAADREELRSGYPDETWVGPVRELHAPWLDPQLDEARSELFLAALRLHEDFLANAAGEMVLGLRAAVEVVAGSVPRRLEPEKLRAAWQTFFLVVPLVSTTFASFGRMFAGLGCESLGWLLIDEAGQASPQYAAGAIWRSQRVVAVGDPLQLQPVVTMPQKAQRDIAAAYRVSSTWIPPRASVQSLADRVSQYGTTLRQGEESVWVSAPLTVHRRCDDPMFSLCNQIAYNGIMVSGVHRCLDDPDRPDIYDSSDGPRMAPSQWFDEPATTAGTHLQPNQIVRLHQELARLQHEGVAMSEVIAISPFRMVANKLESLMGQYPDLRAGTIHTAQGREADVVFLVLGGDPDAPGAKMWASSTVNLVNVAASRAKRRLYVIGDRASWARHNYFDQLSAAVNPDFRPKPPSGG
ncbi:AAA domain-containing protein [Arthrobacter sp. H35-D1]|uniref:DEAD/DEAH box helicase n=1 Tax=Arthrobacter sp. H35-D1 TaxID=3046202 RepID=UPI0024BB5A88|nr:AAA domain-containing protein [Arthrobacter sp. H35-D1]MDJ0313811.1 AAA family ATPase [Arthrobacter sp. H35-D1]